MISNYIFLHLHEINIIRQSQRKKVLKNNKTIAQNQGKQQIGLDREKER